MDNIEKYAIGVLVFVVVIVLCLPLSAIFISNFGKTSGTHAGYVTAVETNSFIYTNQRAYFKTGQDTTQEDTYCIQDPAIYARLTEVSQTGEKVSITFSHPLIEWRWNCGGDSAIITAVTP